MTVLDVIEVFDENKRCSVLNIDGVLLSEYDGKNAIDECFNDKNIVWISNNIDGLQIYINE